jgi:3-oxoacyl-[acyl-carrier-protein] synthase II
MIESRDGRRVVVTGLGVLAPCGVGVAEFWTGLGKKPAPAVVRGVPDFDPGRYGLSKVDARRLDRFAQFGIAAAAQALVDGGLLPGPDAASMTSDVDAERFGVLIGSGIGGALTWEKQVNILRERGERAVSPLVVPMVMPNAGSAAVSMRWGLRGPCEAIATACAAGTHAIAGAARWIASGRADLALAGGAEACLTGTAVAGFGNMRALSPSGVSRPFDVARDGFCAAEGAGVLLLEEATRAATRGARGYAEVAGSGSTADAYHLTAPVPAGAGALRCMRQALADAGVGPDDVTHVNAHGTSTPLNDASEAEAIGNLFGPRRPAVTSIKGVTGHSLGAAGAIEAVALALTYAHRAIPPTIGTANVDPALDIDLVLSTRPWTPAPAISNSFAFGGHNGTLVFQPVQMYQTRR